MGGQRRVIYNLNDLRVHYTYRVFHGFGQAKFAYGGSIFRLKPIYSTSQAASKNDT